MLNATPALHADKLSAAYLDASIRMDRQSSLCALNALMEASHGYNLDSALVVSFLPDEQEGLKGVEGREVLTQIRMVRPWAPTARYTLHVDGDEIPQTLPEFFEANGETLSDEERAGIEALEVGETYTGGGGAGASWALTRQA